MEDTKVNPLLNPLVIKEVYKYLDFPNKKSFRLVCKPWIDTILDLWRKQTKLVIGHVKYSSDGRLNLRPQTADSILEYFNLYKIAEKPLLNLELFRMEFSFLPDDLLKKAQIDNKIARIYQTYQSVQNLLVKHFGQSLEWLDLCQCSFLQVGQFEAGFYDILLKSFPKLKVLSVRQPKMTPSFGNNLILDESAFPMAQSDLTTLNLADRKGFKQEDVKRIWNILPNLKNLSLRGTACEVITALTSPLSSSGNHILLERLGIDSESFTEILSKIPAWIKNYLEAARPPLKCLKASLPFGKFRPGWAGFPEEPFIYTSIWNSVGSTLTSLNLRIWMGLWSWCTLFSGSSLPKLTHLCLNFRGFYDDHADLLYFDFGMLRGTPQLQKLHLMFETVCERKMRYVGTYLDQHELEWNGCSGNDPIVLDQMKDFRFELYHKPTEGSWRSFAKMMPNLRKLQGMVDEDTEPVVRQLWPGLNLTWSNVLWRANYLIKERCIDTESEINFSIFLTNEWIETDWENWEGKYEHKLNFKY